MKKIISFIVPLLLAGVLITGCGAENPPAQVTMPPEVSSSTKPAETVEPTFPIGEVGDGLAAYIPQTGCAVFVSRCIEELFGDGELWEGYRYLQFDGDSVVYTEIHKQLGAGRDERIQRSILDDLGDPESVLARDGVPYSEGFGEIKFSISRETRAGFLVLSYTSSMPNVNGELTAKVTQNLDPSYERVDTYTYVGTQHAYRDITFEDGILDSLEEAREAEKEALGLEQ